MYKVQSPILVLYRLQIKESSKKRNVIWVNHLIFPQIKMIVQKRGIGVYRAIDIGIIYHLLGDKTAVKIFRLQNIIIWIVIGKSLDHPSKKFHHFIFSNFTIHLLKINKIQRKY